VGAQHPDCVGCGAHKSAGSVCRWDPSRVLLDPYAPLVKGRAKFAERDTFERFQEQVLTLPYVTRQVLMQDVDHSQPVMQRYADMCP
jgi:hypothetical protein